MDERDDRLVGLQDEEFESFDEALAAAWDFASTFGEKVYVLAGDLGTWSVDTTAEGFDRENITVVRPG